MDSLWIDSRFWVTAAGAIISALVSIIAKRIMGDINRLYERSRKQETEMQRIEGDINNVHQIVSGHIQYHQGLKDGKEEK
jgi:hypothetical protein